MMGKICEIDLESGVKERGSHGWWEWWVDRARRSGRSMNRQDRDRGAEMRLTERTRKLIPETRWGIVKGAISLYVARIGSTRLYFAAARSADRRRTHTCRCQLNIERLLSCLDMFVFSSHLIGDQHQPSWSLFRRHGLYAAARLLGRCCPASLNSQRRRTEAALRRLARDPLRNSGKNINWKIDKIHIRK